MIEKAGESAKISFLSCRKQGERVRWRTHAAINQLLLAESSLLPQLPLYPLISTALARSATTRTMSCVMAYSTAIVRHFGCPRTGIC
jgi:hypothetical protein